MSGLAEYRRRGSVAIEAALAIPVLLILFGAVAQVLITAQSRVYLEQAAYAAARAALAHRCPRIPVSDPTEAAVAAISGAPCLLERDRHEREARRRAEDAARWALVAAAPTTGLARARGCPGVPMSGEDLLTKPGRVAGREDAARNALCYVYEPGNVTVTLDWGPMPVAQPSSALDYPVRATVEFRFPLSTPFRRFVAEGTRGDKSRWKTGSASVTLL